MLHWLAGQKPHENNGDPDTTGYIEPPETPAPVFAVRAFKHAIFGTPATEKPKAPRRHSNTDHGRPGQQSRPRMMRPRSTNDAATLGKFDDAIASEPLPSPTKGILMTPGTAGGKRKTVTFPDHVVDNEEKRPTNTGLPEDCPGKFPSPWTKPTGGDSEHVEDTTQRSGGRSKLTEALEQAREETSRRKVRLGRTGKSQEDLTADLAEPVSESGKYWKREYDCYREKTTAEVKKLVAKQKLAKNYARDKDDQCLELADELKQERKKVDKLQRRTEDLEARLKEYQDLLKQSKAAEESAKDELERIKRGFGTTGYRRPIETATKTTMSSRTEQEARPWRDSHMASVVSQGAKPDPQIEPHEVPHTSTEQPEPARSRRRPREIQTKAPDDLWAPSSTLELSQGDPARPLSRASRAVTCGTGATPLQSLSINSVPKETISLAMSMGLQPPSPTREKRQDSPLQPSEPSAIVPAAANEDLSIPLPSSPFDPDTTMNKPPPSPTAERSARKELRRAAVDTKENVSPINRPKSKDGAEKPSAAWSAMNAPAFVDKRQKALEKARERLASRGRIVS
ncbi:Putative spindle pole body-associated protein cut12 [Septoria linicola]|uniref:Spindle pole body-associated protein cut12 n=1 Tax=Septoria linicola TaxID=215465 RepID=A0A9Q9ATI2_9PEZI|nr:putative spindle pole body-associated protein cut12 [Septoria linicola]USW51666.1 Putative spindle pole body-associated protein cut12 [Septoria linicola]